MRGLADLALSPLQVRSIAESQYRINLWTGDLEGLPETLFPPGCYALILAAHVLEHLDDAPAAAAKCARLLAPGGELWVVVPDDSDPCNPDHVWMGGPDAWRACVEAAGLAVERVAVRRYIQREQFVYIRARKP